MREAQEIAHRDAGNIAPIMRLLPQHYMYYVLKTNDSLCPTLRKTLCGSGRGLSGGQAIPHYF